MKLDCFAFLPIRYILIKKLEQKFKFSLIVVKIVTLIVGCK